MHKRRPDCFPRLSHVRSLCAMRLFTPVGAFGELRCLSFAASDFASTSGRGHEAGQAPAGQACLYPTHVKLGSLQKATVAVLSAVGASLKCAEPSAAVCGLGLSLSWLNNSLRLVQPGQSRPCSGAGRDDRGLGSARDEAAHAGQPHWAPDPGRAPTHHSASLPLAVSSSAQ